MLSYTAAADLWNIEPLLRIVQRQHAVRSFHQW